jgi:hypothetical protein
MLLYLEIVVKKRCALHYLEIVVKKRCALHSSTL